MLLPEEFLKRTKDLLGEEFDLFISVLEQPAPTSIRLNNKMNYQPSDEKVDWCESGYYLDKRPLFTADPLFHAGVYYVQEASSMFLYQAITQHFPNANKVLDLCAAPGGKSTLISQTLPESSLLVSNEIVRSRAYILAENLIKWGNPNVVVTNNEPKDFDALPNYFDAIIIDAPCSGEGMFRKDPASVNEWSENNVKICAERQRDIVSSVWDSLQTDGILVYSTCTYNRFENENNVEWICNELGAEILKIDIGNNSNITVSDFGYRFYPHKTKGEGFFIAVMRKTSSVHRKLKFKSDNKNSAKKISATNFTEIQLSEPNRWIINLENNVYKAYEQKHLQDFQLLNSEFKCLHSGILLGEQKGKDFIPSYAVAFSKKLNSENLEKVEVDYETAISFLKKEAIQLPDTKKGFLLITYKNQTLGWVKNVGNRCNNLYPQEWRIRMNL